MTLQSLHIYDSPNRVPGAFDSFLGGFFLVKGIPLIGQLGVLTLFGLALTFAFASLTDPKAARFSKAASSLLFLLLWLFLLQPWDEVFINLRHALNFAEVGRFSFNRNELLDGTVDFFPYWILGWLHRTGLPLLELTFLMSLAGAVGCIWMASRFFRFAKNAQAEPFFFLLVCIYPPLAYNSATGFATTLFAAMILACILFLIFEDRKVPGLILLAMLPLIRVEASLIAVILLLVWIRLEKIPFRRALPIAVAVALPALLHAGVRISVYGHAVPLPVQFKSSIGSLFFFAVGIRNLIADAIATHGVAIAIFIVGAAKLCRQKKIAFFLSSPVGRRFEYVLVALGLFTFPYYLSGGDWFPSYWARYFFPFVFLFEKTLHHGRPHSRLGCRNVGYPDGERRLPCCHL